MNDELRALIREVIRDVLPKGLPVTETVNLSTDEDLAAFVARLLDLDPEARSGLAAAFQRWISAIRDGLQVMQDRGELRADADVPRLACALMAAVEGGLLLAKAQRDVAPLEAALDTVIDHIASLMA